jgi:hypothetical protein
MAPSLRLTSISASVPKPGHEASENEDAIAGDPERMRFAIADGATEGWQSGAWARQLASFYRQRPPTPADFKDWLAAARSDWKPPGSPLFAAWYTEAKEEQGSFATLVGLEFRKSTGQSGLAWKSVAIGDSCLLLLRRDRFEVTFPLSAVGEFGNRPALVPSSRDRRCPEPAWLAGWVEPGDLYLLATDAVARLLLTGGPSPGPPALVPAVREAVETSRSDLLEAALKGLGESLNDDASLIAVRVQEAEPE